MFADRVHGALQQRVAGGMAVGVVDGLQADDVDVGNHERSHRSAGASDLVINVLKAGRARPRPGQPISLGDRELMQQLVTVCLGLQRAARGLRAVTSRLCSVCRCPSPTVSRLGTVSGGTPAALRRPPHDLLAVISRAGAGHKLAIAQLGGLIAGQRRQIASAGDLVARIGRLDTALSAVLALLGAAITNGARRSMYVRVAAVHEIAIAGRLITIGSYLLSTSRSLVTVRQRLVSSSEHPIAIRQLLLVLQRVGNRHAGWYWGAGHDRFLVVSTRICVGRPRMSMSDLARNQRISW